jgi:hypothetical protein
LRSASDGTCLAARVSSCAPSAHDLDVHAGGDLQLRRMSPGGELVGEGLEAERPRVRLVEGDVDLPAVETVAERREAVQALLVVRRRAARARR